MILCTQVLSIINARIRIVQNFVDRPSASTSSASSRRVLLYKAFMRAKICGKRGNPAIRFYKQRYTERYVILLNVRNIFQGKLSLYRFLSLARRAYHDHETSPPINVGGKYWGFSSGKVPKLCGINEPKKFTSVVADQCDPLRSLAFGFTQSEVLTQMTQ